MAELQTSQLEKIRFIMEVLSTVELPKPDWAKVAVRAGPEKAENVQKKFKRIAGEVGFDLVADQIVKKDGEGEGVVTRAAKKAATSRKRKSATKKVENGDAAAESAGEEGVAKRAKLALSALELGEGA